MNTANVHSKEPKITEKTAETKTGPDVSSRKWLFNFRKQEGLDKTPLKKDSDPQKDEENTEETKKQNKGKPGSAHSLTHLKQDSALTGLLPQLYSLSSFIIFFFISLILFLPI